MDKSYLIAHLDELLINTENLKYERLSEADNLKAKVVATLREFFPTDNDWSEIASSKFVSIFPLTEVEHKTLFYETKSLISNILGAKISILQLMEKSDAQSFEISANTVTRGALKTHFKEKNDKIGYLESENILLQKRLGDLSKTNTVLEEEVKKQKKLRILKDVGIGLTIIGGTFTLGMFVGNYKYDVDKNNMADKIKTQLSTIDSLKNIISPKLKK